MGTVSYTHLEKEALTEIAQAHEFEIISLGGGRERMELPEYRAAAQRLENENRQLKVQVEYLEEDLSRARGFSARLQEGIGAVLDFLDRHLPEQFRPLVEKARELLPVPEVQQPEREQERSHTWGGMEL